MIFKHLVAIAIGSMAGSVAVAADGPVDPSPLTRAQVRQSVIAAREAGELLPAGEGWYPVTTAITGSTLTRHDVKSATLRAREDGTLLAAGEASSYPQQTFSAASGLTRSDVRSATLVAARAGELISAGEGDRDYVIYRPRSARQASPKVLGQSTRNP